MYDALNERLQSERGGTFFFGSKPSSLDALLFSHLSYHRGAPSSAPELRQAVGSALTVAHVHPAHDSCLLMTGCVADSTAVNVHSILGGLVALAAHSRKALPYIVSMACSFLRTGH